MFEIPLLVEYDLFIRAYTMLRGLISERVRGLTKEQISHKFHANLNRDLKKGAILPRDVSSLLKSTHSLRALYAAFVTEAFDHPKTSVAYTLKMCLGHENMHMSHSYTSYHLEGMDSMRFGLLPIGQE